MSNEKFRLKLPEPFIGLFPSCSGIILCKNDKFEYNLMPCGLIGAPSLNPPTIGVSVYKGHYTSKLLKKYKEFTLNIINKKLIKKSIQLGMVSGRNVDKIKKYKMGISASKKISSPILDDSPVNIECKIIKTVNLGNFHYFIGEIVYTHIAKDCLKENDHFKIDFRKLEPVAALFLDFYGIDIKKSLGRYKAN